MVVLSAVLRVACRGRLEMSLRYLRTPGSPGIRLIILLDDAGDFLILSPFPIVSSRVGYPCQGYVCHGTCSLEIGITCGGFTILCQGKALCRLDLQKGRQRDEM